MVYCEDEWSSLTSTTSQVLQLRPALLLTDGVTSENLVSQELSVLLDRGPP